MSGHRTYNRCLGKQLKNAWDSYGCCCYLALHFTNRKARCRVRVAGCNVVVDAIVRNQIVAIVVECGGSSGGGGGGVGERLIIIIE